MIILKRLAWMQGSRRDFFGIENYKRTESLIIIYGTLVGNVIADFMEV